MRIERHGVWYLIHAHLWMPTGLGEILPQRVFSRRVFPISIETLILSIRVETLCILTLSRFLTQKHILTYKRPLRSRSTIVRSIQILRMLEGLAWISLGLLDHTLRVAEVEQVVPED